MGPATILPARKCWSVMRPVSHAGRTARSLSFWQSTAATGPAAPERGRSHAPADRGGRRALRLDRVNAGRLQCVALRVQRLGAVGLRDASVADQHVSQTTVCDTCERRPRGAALEFRPGGVSGLAVAGPLRVQMLDTHVVARSFTAARVHAVESRARPANATTRPPWPIGLNPLPRLPWSRRRRDGAPEPCPPSKTDGGGLTGCPPKSITGEQVDLSVHGAGLRDAAESLHVPARSRCRLGRNCRASGSRRVDRAQPGPRPAGRARRRRVRQRQPPDLPPRCRGRRRRWSPRSRTTRVRRPLADPKGHLNQALPRRRRTTDRGAGGMGLDWKDTWPLSTPTLSPVP